MTVYSPDHDMNDMARQAVAEGWIVEKTRGDHLRWTWPPTGDFFVSASTPRGRRTYHRVRARMRQILEPVAERQRVVSPKPRKRVVKPGRPVGRAPKFDMRTADGERAYTRGQPGPARLCLADVMPPELVAIARTAAAPVVQTDAATAEPGFPSNAATLPDPAPIRQRGWLAMLMFWRRA